MNYLRHGVLIFALALSAFAQDQEQYPGQSAHTTPPDGWACSHDAKDDAHKCSCVRKCVPEQDEEGNPTGRLTVQEDNKCGAFCHPTHCHCQVKCQST